MKYLYKDQIIDASDLKPYVARREKLKAIVDAVLALGHRLQYGAAKTEIYGAELLKDCLKLDDGTGRYTFKFVWEEHKYNINGTFQLSFQLPNRPTLAGRSYIYKDRVVDGSELIAIDNHIEQMQTLLKALTAAGLSLQLWYKTTLLGDVAECDNNGRLSNPTRNNLHVLHNSVEQGVRYTLKFDLSDIR